MLPRISLSNSRHEPYIRVVRDTSPWNSCGIAAVLLKLPESAKTKFRRMQIGDDRGNGGSPHAVGHGPESACQFGRNHLLTSRWRTRRRRVGILAG